jgi:hypothetical protein
VTPRFHSANMLTPTLARAHFKRLSKRNNEKTVVLFKFAQFCKLESWRVQAMTNNGSALSVHSRHIKALVSIANWRFVDEQRINRRAVLFTKVFSFGQRGFLFTTRLRTYLYGSACHHRHQRGLRQRCPDIVRTTRQKREQVTDAVKRANWLSVKSWSRRLRACKARTASRAGSLGLSPPRPGRDPGRLGAIELIRSPFFYASPIFAATTPAAAVSRQSRDGTGRAPRGARRIVPPRPRLTASTRVVGRLSQRRPPRSTRCTPNELGRLRLPGRSSALAEHRSIAFSTVPLRWRLGGALGRGLRIGAWFGRAA